MPDTALPRYSHREIMHMLSGTMLGMFLGAIDQTIVATALPAMAGELHGMEYMSWAVSAYLLSSTAATPIYGKLSDLYGRRPLFITAIAIFLLGSVVCALAGNMAMLIAGRAVQGLGGGGLISLAQTIIADLVPPRERARYQAYFSTVWTVSTIGGPMLGGFLVDVASWRWVFWINLPIAVAALLVCNTALKRLPVFHRTAKIDYLGASLMVPAIIAVLLVTTWAGTEYPWTSPVILGLLVVALLLLALLILQELRAEDPILPLRLFRNNVFVIGNGLGFLMGASSVGATIFLPLFLQVVIGASASNSGLLITPMMIGISIGAFATSQFVRRHGRYKFVPLTAFAVSGAAFLLFMGVTRNTSPLLYTVYMTALGLGFGPLGPMVSIAVQNAVELRDLGTATALTSFFRSMGGAFGVSLMGAILFAGLAPQMTATTPGLTASGLLHGGPAMIATLPEGVRQSVIAGFAHSFRYVYLAGVALCLIAFALSIFLKELPLRSRMPRADNAPGAVAARSAAAFAEAESAPPQLE